MTTFQSVCRAICALTLAAFASTATASPTPDAELGKNRVAIIVGNADYVSFSGLPNAINDADLVSGHLARHGYHIIDTRNLTRSGFFDLMARLQTEIPEGSDSVFFYAGHGVQVGDVNYLLPVDADIASVNELALEAVSLSAIIDAISARSNVKVFFLDSCRNNPFVGTEAVVTLETTPMPVELGFSFQSAPVNSVMAFATAPGAVAYDGHAENSPFTQALVSNSRNNVGVELPTLLSKVRRDVFQATNGRQVSWQTSSLVEPFALTQGAGAPVVLALLEPEVVAAPAPVDPISRTLQIVGQYDRSVPMGQDLLAALNGASGAVTISKAPDFGFLKVREPGGAVRTLYKGSTVAGDRLGSLFYAPTMGSDRVRGIQSRGPTDWARFEQGGTSINLEIALQLHPCDALAGGNFDPQGIMGNSGTDNFELSLQAVSALRACREAVQAFPDVTRFKYQLSRAARANRLYDESERYLREAAAEGYIGAWNNLASAVVRAAELREGTAVDGWPQEALTYLRKGHDAGDIAASYALGRQLLRYGESRAIQREGYDMLIQAYQAGLTEALTELGYFYLSTESDLSAPERGLSYLRKAAQLGNVSGQHSLGIVLGFGRFGVTQDRAEGERLFRAATQARHPVAPRNLARLLAESASTPEEYREVLAYFDLALYRGDAWGGVLGARLIGKGKVSGAGLAEAATRAARAAVVQGKAGDAARKILKQIDRKSLDTGTQMLLEMLGYDITVDGAFGPGSKRILRQALTDHGEAADTASPQSRLLAAARMMWKISEVRPEVL